MDVLIICIAVVLFVGSIIGSIMGNMIASELYDRAPSFAVWLIERSASRLPEYERDRYREEWCAHLDDCPGKLGKLWHAMGCAYSTGAIAAALAKRQSAHMNQVSRIRPLSTEVDRKTARRLGMSLEVWEELVRTKFHESRLVMSIGDGDGCDEWIEAIKDALRKRADGDLD